MDNIVETVKRNPTICFVLVSIIIVVVAFYIYKMQKESMTDVQYSDYIPTDQANNIIDPVVQTQTVTSGDPQNIYPNNVGYQASDVTFPVTGKDLLPLDLLPKSSDAAQNEADASGLVPNELTSRNYLVGGFNVGIDTQGSSNKNATYDIRGDVPIPANLNTTPFNQSSLVQNEFTRQFVLTNN